MKPTIRLVVTDLDNTLYDWVSFFVPSFYAMVDEAVELLQVDRERLLDDLQEVHVRYGTSEQPFALLETKVVEDRLSGKSTQERVAFLDPAFHAFNRVRKETLKAYPGVIEGLRTLAGLRCEIVAHTEAPVVNALFRLNSLSISPFLKALYATATHGPGHPDPARAKVRLPNHGIHVLNSEQLKPAPDILRTIIDERGVLPSETLYIGDSLTRDIAMARGAGARSAWAKYGRSFTAEDWQRLVRVTHWTEADVARESELRQQFAGITADVDLSNFADISNQFNFEPSDSDVRLGSSAIGTEAAANRS